MLVDCAHRDDLVGFIAEHRRINPGIPMSEAKSDFARFRELIGQRASGCDPTQA